MFLYIFAVMRIEDGDLVYIIFDRKRKYIRTVKRGEQFHTDRGYIDYSEIIGEEYGTTIKTEPYGKKAYLLKPIPSDIVMKMGRASQIIYPEDIGMILVYTGISPGYKVVEAGCGSGSLTSIMANHVKPNGHVYTYDVRDRAVKQAEKNIKKMKVDNFVTVKLRDIITEEPEHFEVDVVVLDMGEPWLAIPNAHKMLKNSGILCSFSPVIEQVKKTHMAMRKAGFFELETYELLKRSIQVKRNMNATRPRTRMVGHTGYLTFGRKITDNVVEKKKKKPEKDEFFTPLHEKL